MIDANELDKQAKRHKLIKQAAERIKQKKAAERVDRRRDLEDKLYLKQMGVEL
jgi:hypothetical protein